MTSEHTRTATPIRPIGGLRVAATVLIAVVALLNVALSWSLWDTYHLVQSYLDGGEVAREDASAANHRTKILFPTYVAALVLAGVAFVLWLLRARDNAERLSTGRHAHGRAWVVFGWIVPGVNLWFPFQVVRDVWRASNPKNRGVDSLQEIPASLLIALWWGLWVTSLVIDRLNYYSQAENLDDLPQVAGLQTVVSVLQLAAAVVVLRVMAEISGWQERVRRGLG